MLRGTCSVHVIVSGKLAKSEAIFWMSKIQQQQQNKKRKKEMTHYTVVHGMVTTTMIHFL